MKEEKEKEEGKKAVSGWPTVCHTPGIPTAALTVSSINPAGHFCFILAIS